MDTKEVLLKAMLKRGVRADDLNRPALDSLIEQGLCELETPAPFRGKLPQPIYRLTEKGQTLARSL
jgi:hypothetical protein